MGTSRPINIRWPGKEFQHIGELTKVISRGPAKDEIYTISLPHTHFQHLAYLNNILQIKEQTHMDNLFANSTTTINAIKGALIPIAEKMGQGAEYAWDVIIKQQYVIAAIDIVWTVGFLVLIGICVWAIRSANKALERNSRSEGAGFGVLVSFVGLAISIVAVLINIADATAHIINPDYYALQFFIDLVKSST